MTYNVSLYAKKWPCGGLKQHFWPPKKCILYFETFPQCNPLKKKKMVQVPPLVVTKQTEARSSVPSPNSPGRLDKHLETRQSEQIDNSGILPKFIVAQQILFQPVFALEFDSVYQTEKKACCISTCRQDHSTTGMNPSRPAVQTRVQH